MAGRRRGASIVGVVVVVLRGDWMRVVLVMSSRAAVKRAAATADTATFTSHGGFGEALQLHVSLSFRTSRSYFICPTIARNVASTTKPRSLSLLQLCCQNHSFCYFSRSCELPRIPAHLHRRPDTTMNSSAIPARSAIPSSSFLAPNSNPFTTAKTSLQGYMSVSTSKPE